MKVLYLKQVPIPMVLENGQDSQEVIAARALGQPWPSRYRVERVTGSTVPKIGEYLSTQHVDVQYLDRDDWRVEIS